MTTVKYSILSLIFAVILASHPTFNGLVAKANAYLLTSSGVITLSPEYSEESFSPDPSCKLEPQHKTNVVANNLSCDSGFYPVDSYAKK